MRGLEESFHYLQEIPWSGAGALKHWTGRVLQCITGLLSDHASHFCPGECLLYKVGYICSWLSRCNWNGSENDLNMKINTVELQFAFLNCLIHFSRSIICHFPKQKTTNKPVPFSFVALQVFVLVHRVNDKPQAFFLLSWLVTSLRCS